jgi:hypothetical protein
MACPNIAWAHRRSDELQLPALASWLFVTIAELADRKTLSCRPTQKILAEKTRLSIRQVNKLLPFLAEKKCIEVIGRSGQRLEYRLLRNDDDQSYARRAEVPKEEQNETYAQDAEVDSVNLRTACVGNAETYARGAEEPTHVVRSHMYPLKYPLKEDPKLDAREEASPPMPDRPMRVGPKRYDDIRIKIGGPEDGKYQGEPLVSGWHLTTIFSKALEIAGIDPVRAPVTEKPVISWLHDGIDPDDIYAGIRRVVRRGNAHPISLQYFDQAVREQAARRHVA